MRSGTMVALAACLTSIGWSQTPSVAEGGVLNAASLAREQIVTPGSLVAIFGSDLAPGLTKATTIPLPTTLNTVAVTFNGTPAPLLFVSPNQINAQLPWNLPASGTVNIVVTRAGLSSAARSVRIGPFSPGIFALNFGRGQAIAINTDGSLAAPAGSVPGYATRPARPGDALIILGTGLGAVAPAAVTGAASSDTLRTATTSPSVLVAGREATVAFAGLSPDFVGVNQLNVVLPADLSGGSRVPLQLRVGGITTTDEVTIAVEGAPSVGSRTLREVSSVPILGSSPRSVALNGSVAYVCGSENITVVDISDPANARVGSRFGDDLFNNVGNLQCYVDGNRLIASADTGSSLVVGTSPSITVFDLSDPQRPQLIRQTGISKSFMGLGYVQGNTILIPTNTINFSGSTFLDQRGDLLAVDVSNTANIRVAGTLFTGQPNFNQTSGGPNNFWTVMRGSDTIALAGSSTSVGAATASGSGRVMAVDISDPSNLRLVRDLLIPGTRQILTLGRDGNLGIAVGAVEGWRNPIDFPQGAIVGPTVVTMLDLADPRTPGILRTISTPVRPDLRGGGIAVIAPNQFVVGGTREGNQPVFLLIDASNRGNPTVATVTAPVIVNDVKSSGGYVYAALEGSGLSIYRVE